MKIYYATTNDGKFEEAHNFFAKYFPIIELEQFDQELLEIQSLDQRAIALHKAQQAWDILKKPVLVDDTGIFFEKYKDFPGTMSKFIIETLGFNGIFKLIKAGDKASLQLTLAFAYGQHNYQTFEGKVNGTLVDIKDNPFPTLSYTAIFVPEGAHKTLAQLKLEHAEELYNHRIIALKKFLVWFNKSFKNE